MKKKERKKLVERTLRGRKGELRLKRIEKKKG